MPINSDDTWICQVCQTSNAARAEGDKYVCWRSCPVCQRVTKHKTIIPDTGATTDLRPPIGSD